MSKSQLNIKNAWTVIGFFLFVIFSFLLICNRAMLVLDNHDEHQFMASAYLFATRGLLPYRDYAYFHMPNLIFVYALIYKLTTYRLLYTRLFSIIFGTLTVTIMFVSTYYFFKKKKFLAQFSAALLAGLFLLANPLFVGTSGRAWNHDVPVVLTLIAALLYYHSRKFERPCLLVGISGGLLGLAIGTRLSFVTIIPAFLLTLKFHPSTKSSRDFWYLLLSFTLGGVVSMLPSIMLFGLAPKNFIFGNIEYANLNTLYRAVSGWTIGMNKIKFLLQNIFPNNSNLVIFAALFVFILIPSWLEYKEKNSWEFSSLFFALLALFCIFGSFVPTPAFYQ